MVLEEQIIVFVSVFNGLVNRAKIEIITFDKEKVLQGYDLVFVRFWLFDYKYSEFKTFFVAF